MKTVGTLRRRHQPTRRLRGPVVCMRRRLAGLSRTGLLLLLGLLPAAPARAQERSGIAPGRDYVRFPLQGDLKALFKDRLQHVQVREEFERLLKAAQADPERFKRDRAAQEKLLSHLSDPRFQEELEQALGKHAGALPFDKKDFLQKVEMVAGPTAQHAPVPGGQPEAPAGPTPPEPGPGAMSRPVPVRPPSSADPPGEAEAPDVDWLRQRFESLEDSRIGRVLRDSPAFQQGLVDLQESLLRPGDDGPGAPPWELGKLTSRLRDLDLSRFERGWDKLQGLNLPSLPRPGLPFSGPGPQRFAAPPAPPSGPGALQAVLWLLLLAGGGFLVWRALARLKAGEASRDGRAWRLGPWPVDPSRVVTRADLVRAFEHLSLLVLGPAVRTWNHLAVADGLAGDGPDAARRRNAAAELAGLYEQARYAPEDEPLGADVLTAARQDLCLLAGVAQP
jgi:hypothetical protein